MTIKIRKPKSIRQLKLFLRNNMVYDFYKSKYNKLQFLNYLRFCSWFRGQIYSLLHLTLCSSRARAHSRKTFLNKTFI